MSAHTAAAADKTRRSLVTPEGVPLPFRLADAGERASAFLIDFIALIVLLIALLWLTSVLGAASAWTSAVNTLGAFIIVNFYFILFELRWMGATPGKRLIGLRVIDRHGGPLGADAIVARNLMRQAELWIPMIALIAPEQLFGESPGVAQLIASLWVFIFVLMPLFNKDRLRAGDIIAGTCVVFRPKALLLPDLSNRSSDSQTHEQSFTREQLEVYGIYELQVLEKLLRGGDTLSKDQSMAAVAAQIKQKIGWSGDPAVTPEQFLRAFYLALRANLEKKMLFGRRVTDKYSAQRKPGNLDS